MRGGNGNLGDTFTFAVVVRGNLPDINELIEFLKRSELRVAHQQLGQNKMWIKEGDSDD